MKHTYRVSGMTCTGCQTSVEGALGNLEELTNISIDLEKSEAVLEMTSHVPLEKLQQTLLNAGLHYTIELPDKADDDTHAYHRHHQKPKEKGNGVFYCPMHCEGDKTYDKMGDCPVCGMDLVEQPRAVVKTE